MSFDSQRRGLPWSGESDGDGSQWVPPHPHPPPILPIISLPNLNQAVCGGRRSVPSLPQLPSVIPEVFPARIICPSANIFDPNPLRSRHVTPPTSDVLSRRAAAADTRPLFLSPAVRWARCSLI